MGKQEYEPAPVAPLPTAPPPPYDSQPAYNPYSQATQAPPYQYQPTPVVHETTQQGGQSLYPSQPYHPQPKTVTSAKPVDSPMPLQDVISTKRDSIIGGNPVVVGVVPVLVGPQSLKTTCPNCNASIKTQTVKKSKTLAHLICVGLFFVGCCLCSCLPYCFNSMSVVEHSCPKCRAHLGTYNP